MVMNRFESQSESCHVSTGGPQPRTMLSISSARLQYAHFNGGIFADMRASCCCFTLFLHLLQKILLKVQPTQPPGRLSAAKLAVEHE